MNILVVSPHPDDETLGAGGTILRYKAEGHSIFWLNITNMRESYGYSADDIQIRNNELGIVFKLYGFDGFYNMDLEPAGLDKYSNSEVIGKISNIINEIKPNTIILPYRYDIHSDHNIVNNWINSCTKSFRYPFIKRVLAMETLSETDFASADKGFNPNYFIDISEFLDEKIEIMKVYKSEIGEHPFPRSVENIKALATLRGATAGVRYAEAFELIKEIT